MAYSHWYFGFIMGYLIIVVVYGLYITKREVRTSEEFITGGRRLPLWVVTGTLIATWYGGGAVTGTANLVYTRGPWSGLIYELATPFAIIFVLFLAGRVREQAKATIPELFREKYGDLASVLAAIAIVLAYVGICAYQFKGAGYVLNLTTGMSVGTGTAIAAVVVVLLAVSGGLTSVAYTDAISAFFIFASMISAVPFLLKHSGGFFALAAQIPESHLTFSSSAKIMDTLGFGVATMFLGMGDQNMFIRFGAAKNKRTAVMSALLFILGSVLLSCLTVFISSYAIVYLPGINPDTGFLRVAMDLLPFVAGGGVLSAAIAFMITTGDSFLLCSATNLANDILEPFFLKGISDRKKLFITRILIVVCGFFAYLLITQFSDILGMIMYAYTMYGASITPALVAALCWKRVTPAGGLASIMTGCASTLVWEIFFKNGAGGLDSALVAIPCSIAALVAVSLCTQKGHVKNR